MDFKDKRSFGPTPKYPLVEQYKRPSDKFVVISGPCFLESEELAWDMAKKVSERGATHFRSGVYRAGTYPPDNFGLIDEHLLKVHSEAAHFYGLKNVMDVLDYSPTVMHLFNKYADVFQVGARAMQNYRLLTEVSKYGKPIFLKRGVGNTLDEWLGAAEYLLKNSSNLAEIYLIERGGVSYLNHVRWDLSISLIPAVKAICDLPVIVDASHGTGRRDLVEPMSLAGVAAGADGVLVEVHPTPEKSLSDSEQAITPESFSKLTNKINKLRKVLR